MDCSRSRQHADERGGQEVGFECEVHDLIVVWIFRKKQLSGLKFYRPFQPDGIPGESSTPKIAAAEADRFELPEPAQNIEGTRPSVS